MAEPAKRPSNDDRIKAAQWFARQGFGIFPVWSTSPSGACRCPKGGHCGEPGKHPMTAHGFQDATTDPSRIRTFLSAASEPNYGMICPDGVFAWDLDTDEVRERLARQEGVSGPLPPTLRTDTAKGQHVFWRWPEGHPRPIHQMFGMVTRWGSGRNAGYVIGPHSVHSTGAEYRPAKGSPFEIATLPDTWAVAALGDSDTVRISGQRDPEDVGIGQRHDYLRDLARLYAGTVRDPAALFAAVWSKNLELSTPKSEEEVRRAIGDVLTRFAADPIEQDPETGEIQRVPSDDPGMMTWRDDSLSFPTPPAPVAYGGTLGECVRSLLEGTDASPVAILASLTAFCGALMPAWGYWHTQHTSSPFMALVGKTSIGRKGTAMYRVRDALGYALGMDTVNRVRFDGIASGEALVKALLDRASDTYGNPNGILFEEEYGSFLAASGREGSQLDPRMRSAFDGKSMAHRRISGNILVPEPYYLSGLVGITPTELREKIGNAAFKSGSGNRWLWLPVERRDARVRAQEPILPEDLSSALVVAHLANVKAPPRIGLAGAADDLLSEYDAFLRAETVGNEADMTRRYGVIAFRVGLVHAAVERSSIVTVQHIERALALTEYARRGLEWTFGAAAGDASATHLLRMLLEADDHTLAHGVISKYFLRDNIKRQAAIDDLQRLGLAEVIVVRTNGRKRTELRLRPQRRDFRDFSALFATEVVRDTRAEVAEAPNERETDETGLRESRAEGARKVRESPAWKAPCVDYEAHRDDHRQTADGWVCPACHPGLCQWCGAGPFLSLDFHSRHTATHERSDA